MIIQKIREKTLQYHDDFTGWAFKIMNASASTEEYKQVLRIFYGFYAAWEKKLDQVEFMSEVGLDMQKRKKLPLIINDMKNLGMENEIESLALCDYLPEMNNPAKLLGALYVIEGATLGGQLITKKIDEILGMNGKGAEFFNSYGDNVRPYWKEFMDAINGYSEKTGIEDPVIDSTHEMYMTFNKWLTQLKGVTY